MPSKSSFFVSHTTLTGSVLPWKWTADDLGAGETPSRRKPDPELYQDMISFRISEI